MFTIDFEPIGRRGPCATDQTLLDCARQLGVDLVSTCGGAGSCGRCKVQIVTGKVSHLTLDEEACLTTDELQQGFRLACLTYPQSDLKIHVPPESFTAPQRTQVEGLEVIIEPEPLVHSLDVDLVPPSLEAPLADDQSLWIALSRHGVTTGKIAHQVLPYLSSQLRNTDWQARIALRDSEIVAVGPPSSRWLGLAVDIGTTKIAIYLMDLESGQVLASQGLMNPQISYGEDVVSRIAVASRSPAEAGELQKVLVDALNQSIAELCAQMDVDPSCIVDGVVVGNTVIHHLLLRLPVHQLGYAPYVPSVCAALDIKASEIGLQVAPGAYFHLPPNIAGYVGSDHVAMLLATRLAEADGITLAIDIGTNTEVCLNRYGKMTSLSCASGPAFEGAHIKFGMRAAPGAIESVRLEGEKLSYQTIGSHSPIGVCGSGLLDVVAQLRMNGILSRNGRMEEHPCVRVNEKQRAFVLVTEEERGGKEAITISQQDVRELQLAKAAIRLGIQTLADANHIAEDDIDQVIVAGAFGTFIDIASAVAIGMLPDLPQKCFKQVGNAAGTGARLALIAINQRLEAKRIAQHTSYLELASLPDFQYKFAEATYLG